MANELLMEAVSHDKSWDMQGCKKWGAGFYENRQQHIVTACTLMENLDALRVLQLGTESKKLEFKA